MKRTACLLVVAAAIGGYGIGFAAAAQCYSMRVSGCGKKARICVNSSSSSEAESRALKAFRETYKCASPTVSSYSSSCSEAANDRCELKL